MDDLDRRLLDLIQDGFPIDERPYLRLAERLDTDEDEVIARMQSLMDRGIIRDPSPVFDLHELGYCSTLAALNVPPDRLGEVVEIVNARPEVTHNYLREGEPNLWFTVIAESEAVRDAILGDVERRAACGPARAYPATRTFRVRVAFEFSHGSQD